MITGSSLDDIQKILYIAFPKGTFTEITNDVKSNLDFFDLSSAFVDARKNQQLWNFNTLYFVKTKKNKWLYYYSIKEERAKDVKFTLELNGYEVFSYKEAKSKLIDNGYILRNE